MVTDIQMHIVYSGD